MSWTAAGAGAAHGAEQVLARHLQQQMQAERERAALIEESQRGQQLDIQRENAAATQALAREAAAARTQAATDANTAKMRDDARATLGLIPMGTTVPGADYEHFISNRAAVPGMFTPETQMTGDDGSEPTPTGQYTFKGTAAQQAQAAAAAATQARFEETDQRTREQFDERMARTDRQLNRLEAFGAPWVTWFDPQSPTRIGTGPRNLAPPNAAGPEPPAQRTKVITNAASVELFNNLKTAHDKVVASTGPVMGRVNEIGKVLPLVKTSPEWADFSSATWNLTNATMNAISGAAVSDQEAERIMGQLPKVSDKPEVWEANFRQSVINLQQLEKTIAARNGGAGAAPGPGPGGAPPVSPTPPAPRTIQSGRFSVTVE